MGIRESIFANLINQNPSKSLIAAYNKYVNWIENNVAIESICLLNNNECNNDSESKNKAIDSHLISKSANLKPISKNGKVKTIGNNYKNPINNELKETSIKKATTFPGFCKYHDNLIFMPLEETKIDTYKNEHIFLLILRVVAYKRYQSQRQYKQTSLIIQSFNNEIVKNMLKESTIHKMKIDNALNKKSIKANKFKAIWCFIKNDFIFRNSIKTTNKINCENYAIFDQLSKKLINMLKEKDYSEIVFKQFTTRHKKIAFSSAYNIPLKKNNLFIFLFVLPDNKKNNILVACFKKDFTLLMKDSKIKQCFDGDMNQIQKLINIDSELIVFNDDNFNDYEYAKYIYESDDQIKKLFPPHILK